MTRLLGIDPGSRRLGWGIIDAAGSRMHHVAHGVIAPPGDLDLAARLGVICDGLEDALRRWSPEGAAIEQVFAARSARSALVLGQARGVAMLAIHRFGLPVGEYTPAEIKLAVSGHGRASKEQLATMVQRLLGYDLKSAGHDATDALAVAICHAHGRERQRLVQRARSGGR
jgi:crossover junction endodeoxyribonuclease RuvC